MDRSIRLRQRRRGGRVIFRVVLFLIIIIILLAGIDFALSFNKIYNGVHITNLDVGGYSRSQALEEIESMASFLMESPITLSYRDRSWSLNPKDDLDAAVDVPTTIKNAYLVGRSGGIFLRIRDRIAANEEGKSLNLKIALDRDKASRYLEGLADEINRFPQDAKYDRIRIDFGRDGLEVDVDGSLTKIIEKLENPSENRVVLVVNVVKPEVTSAELLLERGFADLLGTYTTEIIRNIDSKYLAGKIHNIRLAARKINGVIVRPRETFSYNSYAGKGDYEEGYKDGPTIKDGLLVPGEGGGISQVSSTLYNSALLADMKIVQRFNRSIQTDETGYVSIGLDASVFAEQGKDLRIRNTYSNPFVIRSLVEDGKVKVSLYGVKDDPDKTVEIVTKDERVIEAPVREIKDPNLKKGELIVDREGNNGYEIKVYRIIRIDGRKVREELISADTYKSIARIIRVGTKGN